MLKVDRKHNGSMLPEAWLMVLISGLPQLSETVYTPSLPDIARALVVSESMAEYTLTIYLFAFALGILFWGKLSDATGRKPCVMAGIVTFILGCIGCFMSTSITMLMASRFVQAFGGSIGSVLGQAMVRDAFQGPSLGRMYAVFGSSLAVFPAVGPILGATIAQAYGWYSIFIFLISVASILFLLIWWRLPETHHKEYRQRTCLVSVSKRMIKDTQVVGLMFLVACANGINFSFFAEGPFYLVEQLGLLPSQYGSSFIAIASSTMLGGMFSKYLQQHHIPKKVMRWGIAIMCTATTIFSLLVLTGVQHIISNSAMIVLVICLQMLLAFGMVINNGNALAMALVDYKTCTGTASSLFGFSYYMFTSLISFGMGMLHNGTLYPMPIYFCVITWIMFVISRMLVR